METMKRKGRYLKRITLESKILLLLEPYTGSKDLMTVPESITQGGMAKELMIRRNNISRALSDLSSRGLVLSRTKHIKGLQRRRKAYFLTGEGEKEAMDTARDLDRKMVPVKMPDGRMMELSFDKSRKKISSHMGREVTRFEMICDHIRGRMVDLSSVSRSGNTLDDPNVPSPPVIFGREEEMGTISDSLRKSVPMVSLIGIAGQGKTSLASEVVSRISRDVVWIDLNEWMSADVLLDEIEISLSGGGRSSLSGRRGIFPRIRSISGRLASAGAVLVLDDVHRASAEVQDACGLLYKEAVKGGWTLLVISRTRPVFYTGAEAISDENMMELKIEGLKKDPSMEMMASLDVDRRDGERIFDLTSGHPLAMRICSMSPASDATGIMTSFRNYLKDNILSVLEDGERTMMESLSVFEIPVDPRTLIDLIEADQQDLTSLRSRLLIREYPDGTIDLHDSMKEGIESSLSRKRREKLLRVAKEYHGLMSADEDLVQFIITSRELGDSDDVVNSLLLHGDHLIGRGYLSLVSLVTELDPKGLEMKDRVRWELLSHDCDMALGKNRSGLKHLTRAGEIAEGLMRSEGGHASLHLTAMVLNRLAEHGLRQGKQKDVIKRLSRNLKIARRIGAFDQEARTLGNIGSAYLDLGQYELAIRFFDDAGRIFERIGDPKGYAISRLNKGQALSLEADLSGALREYLECIILTRKVKLPALRSLASYRVARLYLFVDEKGDAAEFYRDSVIGYTIAGNMDRAFLVLSEMASVCDRADSGEIFRRTIERMHRIASGGGWTYLKERLGLGAPGSVSDLRIIDHIIRSLSGEEADVSGLESMIEREFAGPGRKIRLNLLSRMSAVL